MPSVLAQPLAEARQQSVAGRMAEGVVVLLEAVEIEDASNSPSPPASGARPAARGSRPRAPRRGGAPARPRGRTTREGGEQRQELRPPCHVSRSRARARRAGGRPSRPSGRVVRIRRLARRTVRGWGGWSRRSCEDEPEDLPQRGGAAVNGRSIALAFGRSSRVRSFAERTLDRLLGALEPSRTSRDRRPRRAPRPTARPGSAMSSRSEVSCSCASRAAVASVCKPPIATIAANTPASPSTSSSTALD